MKTTIAYLFLLIFPGIVHAESATDALRQVVDKTIQNANPAPIMQVIDWDHSVAKLPQDIKDGLRHWFGVNEVSDYQEISNLLVSTVYNGNFDKPHTYSQDAVKWFKNGKATELIVPDTGDDKFAGAIVSLLSKQDPALYEKAFEALAVLALAAPGMDEKVKGLHRGVADLKGAVKTTKVQYGDEQRVDGLVKIPVQSQIDVRGRTESEQLDMYARQVEGQWKFSPGERVMNEINYALRRGLAQLPNLKK